MTITLKKCLPGLLLPIIFLLLALLLQLLPGFILSVASAQDRLVNEEGLFLGQSLPDVNIPHLLNHPAPTARLSDFKGKLLLLNFWATWCSTSRGSIPRLEDLQNRFGDQLQVLLVSKEDRAKVQAYYKSREKEGKTSRWLPTAVEDTHLSELFPYHLVPHVVWISPGGKVMAITSEYHVTPENVRQALKTGTLSVPVKKDISLQSPLFADRDLPAGNLVHFSVLLKGKIDGLPSGTRLRKKGDTVVGRVMTNKPLLDLYETVALHQIPSYNQNRLVLEARNLAALLPEKSDLSHAEWKRQHLYSYDQIGPVSEAEGMYGRMLSDLNQYSGFHGTIEKRPLTCLVLKLSGSPRKIKTKGGPQISTLYQPGPKRMRNAPLSFLVNQLLSEEGISYPVLDETGYSDPVDLDISSDLADLPALRRELQRYNLELVEEQRNIYVLVIRDRQDTPPQ
ncbi:AhpC/TSA family protein [Pontibacter ummariensis]|uniref:AhpC/TSA family protein n=1 Tax=Pontibacter ummariensis TaxID=1610492 RepID=A0A239IE97_9BACT|nr:redoxin domain-containing protein [Pontibacter ummariensis]PRY09808.1 AhpC/TSA family protein [Pontibacter ummariensis]SNS91877.1 AhpC/TSA family protein [Pontibacter ummariensis]